MTSENENDNTIKSITKQLLPKSRRQALRKSYYNAKEGIRDLLLQPARQAIDPYDIISMLYGHMPTTADLILQGIQSGMFLTYGKDTESNGWDNPAKRPHIPIHDFTLRTSTKRYLRQRRFEITVNADFESVIKGCAGRERTWITPTIFDAYIQLHKMGYAHSVEAYQDGELVGGMFGVSLGSYYVLTSLFHSVSDSSKIAFAYVVVGLQRADFVLHDCQVPSNLVEQFGTVELEREEFLRQLAHAIVRPNTFPNTEELNRYMDEAVPAN